jgi:hypothetical protein
MHEPVRNIQHSTVDYRGTSETRTNRGLRRVFQALVVICASCQAALIFWKNGFGRLERDWNIHLWDTVGVSFVAAWIALAVFICTSIVPSGSENWRTAGIIVCISGGMLVALTGLAFCAFMLP